MYLNTYLLSKLFIVVFWCAFNFSHNVASFIKILPSPLLLENNKQNGSFYMFRRQTLVELNELNKLSTKLSLLIYIFAGL